MNKWNLQKTGLAVMFVGISFLAAQEAPVRIEMVPIGRKMVHEESVKDLPPHWAGGLVWPSEEFIRSNQVSLSNPGVQHAIKLTSQWLRTVLLPKWLPGDTVEVLPIQSDVGKEDTIRMRYRADDHVIQISSTSFTLRVAIAPYVDSTNASVLTPESAREYVADSLRVFFQGSDKILSTCGWQIEKSKTGYSGIIKRSPDAWWDGVTWWTNGDITLISMPKIDPTSATLPSSDPEWFSAHKKNSRILK